MRGSTPLDVAAASVMDNNELALALTEADLEKVSLTDWFIYLSFTPLLTFGDIELSVLVFRLYRLCSIWEAVVYEVVLCWSPKDTQILVGIL